MDEYNDIKNNSYWINKYKPRNIVDIVGREEQTKIIINWLDNFENNAKKQSKTNKSCLFITGDHGVGKTAIVHCILTNKNYNIQIIDFNLIARIKTTKDKLDLNNNDNLDKNIDDIDENTNNDNNNDNDNNNNDDNFKNENENEDDEDELYASDKSEYSMKEEIKEVKKVKKEVKNKSNKKVKKTKKIKTTVIKSVLSKARTKTKQQINAVMEFIDTIIRSDNIYNIIIKKNNKRVILIDGLESIIAPIKQTFIKTLLKVNNTDWICPIIIIATNHHEKLIKIIKSQSLTLTLQKPTYNNMMEVIANICTKEHICLDNQTIADKIISQSQGDYRQLINILQNIKQLFPSVIITETLLNKYKDTTKIKDLDRSIFEITNLMLYHYDNIDETLCMYETDKILVPLYIQQHYINTINNTNKMGKIEIYEKVSDLLANADIIESYIYNNQDWNLQEVHGFLSCTYPSYLLSQFNNPNKNKSIKNNFYTFPTDLNKTSNRKKNYKKNILNVNNVFSNINVNDYIYINKILGNLLISRNYTECNNIIQRYNITPDIFESMLKIDKSYNKSSLNFLIKKNIIFKVTE